MALSTLPRLPALGQRPSLTQFYYNDPGRDFGSGYDGGTDFGSFFPGGGFDFPGTGSGASGCGPFDLFCDPRGQQIYGPTGPVAGGGSTPVGGVGGSVPIGGSGGSTSQTVSFLPSLPAINWGRIAAFLLGLLLIGAGLYLIKPIQQAVKVQINTARKMATTAAEAAAA